jgi:hypothetical protein
MGPLPGVTIHAAIAWTQAHPVRELPYAIGVLADILTAFVFSLGIGFFWKRYLNVSLHGQGYQRENSTLLVLGFVLYFAAMLWLFFQLSVVLFMRGILIAPLLIGLSMLIDGFVRGPIAASLELRSGAAAARIDDGPSDVGGADLHRAGAAGAAAAPLVHAAAVAGTDVAGDTAGPCAARAVAGPTCYAGGEHGKHGKHGDHGHGDHGDHVAYPRAHLLAWLLAGALAGVALDQYLALGMDWLLAAFAGVIGGLLLVLFIGLRSLRWRSFSRPARWWTAQLLGVQHAVHGWRELAGALSFCLRHSVYWVVLVAALIVMLSH